MPNGKNNWNVSWSHIRFMDGVLRCHPNVSRIQRSEDILFSFTREKQSDRLTLLCCNEYVLGEAIMQRAIQEFKHINMIWTGGQWNSYTAEAKALSLNLKIGLYQTAGITGALYKDRFWDFHKTDERGNRVDC